MAGFLRNGWQFSPEYTNKEIKTREIKNINDINNFVNYVNLIIKEDNSIYKDTSLNYFFKEFGFNFYKFTAIGTIENPYIQIVALDKDNNFFIINDPILFINNLLSSLKVDTLVFSGIINFYNTIQFINEDVDFITEYNKSIFGSKLSFDNFNKIEKYDNDLILMKMYTIQEQNFIDRYQITYKIQDSIFSVNKVLVNRQ